MVCRQGAEYGWPVCGAWKTCNCPMSLLVLGLSIGGISVSWRLEQLVHGKRFGGLEAVMSDKKPLAVLYCDIA